MARTPLMGRLVKLTRQSLPPIGRSRRRFLHAAVGGVAAAALAGCASNQKRGSGSGPRVVIVGAGIAGLHCAHLLKKGGIEAAAYEAADRVGGRVFTKHDILNTGQTLELGGEFVDENHADMRALCREFGFELLDLEKDSTVKRTAYHFDGRHYSEREVLDALKPFVARIAGDAALLDQDWEAFVADPKAQKLDNTSIAAYLDGLGMDGWLRKLVDVAFVTEFGLDADQQSAFNLLSLIGLDVSGDRWEAFGEGAERYKVRGGNQQVTDALARSVDGQVNTARKLEAATLKGGVFELSFSGSLKVKADHVVLAIPFTMLREVDLQVDLPAEKTKAIAQLGYGTNAKLMLGTSSRPWRDAGYAGDAFSDAGFQLAWDCSRMQPIGRSDLDYRKVPGGLTLYSGGAASTEISRLSPREQVERLLPGIEKVYPGTEKAHNHKVFRMHWPTHAFTKASYACYRPGQWTTIAGHEGTSVGNLHFAGEHCSSDFQGYMNGGAETGRLAAEAILAAAK